MEVELNSSLQLNARKGHGLSRLNNWKSLACSHQHCWRVQRKPPGMQLN